MYQQQLAAIEQAVTDIASDLLAKRKTSPQGFYWENTAIEPGSLEIVQQFTHDLYNGNAGVVWFFNELYKVYPRPQYLETITGGLNHMLAEQPKQKSFGFYTGNLGLAYLCLQAYSTTKQKRYVEEAVHIGANCPSPAEIQQQPVVIFDLLSGIAGSLLVLTHLYIVSNDEKMYARIMDYTGLLLENTRLSPQGFFWDQGENQILPIAGFSHGAGGVGYVLLQLGHYFNKALLIWCGKQAYAYENSLYSPAMRNWPDYRQGITDDKGFEKASAAFAGNPGYFTEPKEMVAWCHGAPGIGLSRVGTAPFCTDAALLADIDRAAAKTASDIAQYAFSDQRESLNYGLCHGYGGNALLLYEVDKYRGQQQYSGLLFETAMAAIAQKKQKGYYRSGYNMLTGRPAEGLLLGDAGVGCFFLSFLNATNYSNILLPRLPENVSNHQLNWHLSTRQLLQHSFPMTLHCIALLQFENEWADTTRGITAEGLVAALAAVVEKSGHTVLQDVWTFELERLRFSQAIRSQSLLYLSERKALEAATTLTDPLLLLQKQFIVSSSIKHIVTKWNWLQPPAATVQNLTSAPGSFQVLLRQTCTGVTAAALSDFSYDILISFQTERSARVVADTLLNEYELATTVEQFQFEVLLAKQLKEFVLTGLLTEAAVS